jgi:sulfatase modifying factor 1
VTRTAPARALLCTVALACSTHWGCSNPVHPKQRSGTPAPLAAPAPTPKRAAARPAEPESPPAEPESPPAEPEPPQTPCPSEMALVGAACVDRWEAILVTRGPDARLTVHPHAERPEQGVRYEARSVPGVFPQAYVNRLEAETACVNAGKRLCTLEEWFAACRGPKRTAYPYGPTMKPGRCNSGKPHLLSQWFGNDPKKWKYDEHFNSPRLDQEPGFLAKTGEYADCVNDYGAYDMVGNLHEWVSTPVNVRIAAHMPLTDGIRVRLGKRSGNGIFMGGFFSTYQQHGEGCGFITIGHQPNYHDYSTGFRCCMDARASAGGPGEDGVAPASAISSPAPTD